MKTRQKAYKEIIEAYSDCNKSGGERNLDFFSDYPLSANEFKSIASKAIPMGYNYFDSNNTPDELVEIFGKGAKFHFAREGSVCVYVKAKSKHINVDKIPIIVDQLNADECHFDNSKLMFRFWWD